MIPARWPTLAQARNRPTRGGNRQFRRRCIRRRPCMPDHFSPAGDAAGQRVDPGAGSSRSEIRAGAETAGRREYGASQAGQRQQQRRASRRKTVGADAPRRRIPAASPLPKPKHPATSRGNDGPGARRRRSPDDRCAKPEVPKAAEPGRRVPALVPASGSPGNCAGASGSQPH